MIISELSAEHFKIYFFILFSLCFWEFAHQCFLKNNSLQLSDCPSMHRPISSSLTELNFATTAATRPDTVCARTKCFSRCKLIKMTVWVLYSFTMQIHLDFLSIILKSKQECDEKKKIKYVHISDLCCLRMFFSNRKTKTFGSEAPMKPNNSQDICTRLQIKKKPPSGITFSTLTWILICPGNTTLFY